MMHYSNFIAAVNKELRAVEQIRLDGGILKIRETVYSREEFEEMREFWEKIDLPERIVVRLYMYMPEFWEYFVESSKTDSENRFLRRQLALCRVFQ